MASKTILYTYLNTSGQTVTHYNDGTETISGSTTTSLANQSQTWTPTSVTGNYTVNGDNSGDIIDARYVLGGTAKSPTSTATTGNYNLFGGNGKDILYANNASDYLSAGNGVDVLVAGAGHDALSGGNGSDWLVASLTGTGTFVYDAAGDSPYVAGAAFTTPAQNAAGYGAFLKGSANWDVVSNFSHTLGDTIDLSLIDGMSGGAASQLTGGGPSKLVWAGAQSDAASGASNLSYAHAVWTDTTGSFLYADVNGDGKADLKIQVHVAGASDIIGLGGNLATNPVANADANSVTEITQPTATGNVLANDHPAVSGDTIAVSTVNGSALNVGHSVAGDHGTLTLNANGSYNYTTTDTSLLPGQTASDVFHYTDSENGGGAYSANLTITVNGTAELLTVTGGDYTGSVTDSGVTPNPAIDSTDGDVYFTDANHAVTHTASFVADSSNTTSLGTFSLGALTDSTGGATGSQAWSFNVADADIAHLAAGVSVTQTYDVTVSDIYGGSQTEQVSVVIHGTNDAATITGADTGGVTEDGTLTASGVLTVSDVDDNQSAAQMVTDGTSALGTYTVAADGTWNYQVDNAAIQHLGGNDTASDSFVVTSADGGTTHTVNIAIQGTNDVATITGTDTGSVTEDGTLTASGVLTVSDVDDNQSAAQVVTNGTSALGTYTVAADGTWNYQVDNAAIQHLGGNDSTSDSFVVTSADGGTTHTVDITIQGTNDVATIAGADTGSVTEDGTQTASGVLTVSDVDDNQSAAQMVTDGTSALGTYTVAADGTWNYQVDNAAIQHLGGNDTASDSFVVTSADGGTTHTVNIAIQGTNDVATITGTDTGSVTEDGTQTASGVLAVSDVDDNQSAAQVVTNGTSTLGTYTVAADGTWNYQVNNAAIQHLGGSDSTSDSFVVTSADGGTTHTVNIAIHGTNDAAAIGGQDTGSVVEATSSNAGTPTTSGVLTVSDPDDNQSAFQALNNVGTTYGHITLDASGNWSYALDNSNPTVNALNTGDALHDLVTVASVDGTTHQVDVTINGATDATPVIDLGGPTGIAFNINQNGNNSNSDVGSFVATGDPDSGDTFTYSGTFTGSAGSASVTSAGVLSAPSGTLGDLAVTATDAAGNHYSMTFHVWTGDNQGQIESLALTSNNIADGLGGADNITGSNGTDYLVGGSGNDTIAGLGGADQLAGQNGIDTFLYTAATDSTRSAFDTILDFTHNTDIISFLTTLGLATDAGNIGAATSLAAHTVGWEIVGADTVLYANTGGGSESLASGADVMEIHLTGVANLATTDINLHG